MIKCYALKKMTGIHFATLLSVNTESLLAWTMYSEPEKPTFSHFSLKSWGLERIDNRISFRHIGKRPIACKALDGKWYGNVNILPFVYLVLQFPRGRRGDRLLQNLQYCCNVTFHLIKIVVSYGFAWQSHDFEMLQLYKCNFKFHSSCWTTIILLVHYEKKAKMECWNGNSWNGSIGIWPRDRENFP